ncbi:alkylhydroperoxidase domain protein, partial [Cronobacter sakazakii]
LINGGRVAGETAIPPAGRWHTKPTTQSGQPAPTAFTQDELGWEPWLAPKALAAFSPDEQETLRRFGHQDSGYFRLLARNLPALEARTLTDKGIFYTPGGLARAERELAAAVASKVNGCIYCASVHARKASQLSKDNDAVQRLLEVVPGGSLSAGQSARWQAIIDFSAALSATPATAGAAHVAALREQALTDLELLDLVQATAFFAWANRLMLTLGEPFIPA